MSNHTGLSSFLGSSFLLVNLNFLPDPCSTMSMASGALNLPQKSFDSTILLPLFKLNEQSFKLIQISPLDGASGLIPSTSLKSESQKWPSSSIVTVFASTISPVHLPRMEQCLLVSPTRAFTYDFQWHSGLSHSPNSYGSTPSPFPTLEIH